MTMRNFKKNKTCRYCGSGNLLMFLSLGEQPPSDNFIKPSEIKKEKKYPLDVYFCKNCSLVQLLDVVDKKTLFDDYLYISSTSSALKNHYSQLARLLTKRFKLKKGDSVVDIGCNDGILLEGYSSNLVRVGVEPSKVAGLARSAGFEVEKSFFDQKTAKKIVKKHGTTKIATATNVFAHVDDIGSFVDALGVLLGKEGVFVVEAPYLIDMIDQTLFDTIYHEHLCYLSLTPMVPFLKKHGFEVFDIERIPFGASGPAIRIFIQPKIGGRKIEKNVGKILLSEEKWGVAKVRKYLQYRKRVEKIKREVLKLINDIRKAGFTIGGYGAPAKGSTLLNYFQINNKIISKIAEANPAKFHLLTPGSHIPIVSDDEFLRDMPDYALLLTWNYLDFFLRKSEFIKKGGKFIVPLPRPRILP